MYKELSKILRCPECKGKLIVSIVKEENDEIIEGKLTCENSHNWIIKDGVVNFGSKEQELANTWSESYKQMEYKELDKQIVDGIPKNTKEINNKVKGFIINEINTNKEINTVLDIATGRGMLLTELAKYITTDAQIICTDLSFDVLKYDRLKVEQINPNIKVNYIACDATKLPFKENSIDLAVSFYGIANMLDKMGTGIVDAKRVLKDGTLLLNSGFIIKENSQGYNAAKEWFASNNIFGAENLLTETGFEKAHSDANFNSTKLVKIGEDIGEKCEFDLIPFEGEWFSVVIAQCEK
jgi:ubiquinone/menaquinone biosynthesis C-methylase UbiE/uncharacterized protein YbaR (Trm112 family)